MAIMNINFTSRCLAMKTSVWVAYPTPTLGEMMQRKDKYDPEKRWPVAYMLHGAGGDGFEWIQRADMEQLCCQYGFIAVMPDAALSCYNDTPYGAKYYTYISEELPAMIEATFHASTDAKDRYIMGYSLGGFGAVKIGLMNPDRYCSPVFPKPMPGSRMMFSSFTPAASAMESVRSKKDFIEEMISPSYTVSFWLCIRMAGTP